MECNEIADLFRFPTYTCIYIYIYIHADIIIIVHRLYVMFADVTFSSVFIIISTFFIFASSET